MGNMNLMKIRYFELKMFLGNETNNYLNTYPGNFHIFLDT